MIKNLLLILLITFTGILSGQDIETGLVARYSFCGDLTDESTNNNDGVFMGPSAPAFTADVYGNENSAIYMNGVGDWVKIEPSESINSPLEEATVACWVYYQSLAFGQWVAICAKTDGVAVLDRQYSLGINHTTGQIYWHSTYVATAPMQLNTWYHIAITYTPEMLKCYLDGEFIGEAVPVDPIAQNDEPFEIGRDTPVAIDYFHGVLDEMNIYSRALSASDVMALKNYNGCTNSSTPEKRWDGNVDVYPNPVVSELHIRFQGKRMLRNIALINSLGQVVSAGQSDSDRVEITMHGLQNGVYFLQVHSAEGFYTQKILK
ncbi:MAG: LamG-like jellyroll fold domain-containing protein [Bacteroidales bacterium]